MSPGLGYSPSEAAQNHVFPNQIVDNAPRGLGQQVAAQIEALEMSTAGYARRTHNDVLRSNTGWFTDAVSWAKRRAASQTLEQQTAHLAGALGRAGISVTREGDVTLIGGVTGIIEQQPVYRAVRILPSVAGRDRRPILNDAKFWMGNHPHRKYFRFAVMTCPEPVPVGGDLRGAIQGLSRRISKWASAVEEFGVRVLYRGIEFTRDTAAERGMEDRYDPDTILYHVHANVVFWPTRKMKDEEFQKFLKFTRNSVGAWWRDNGKVERLEEVIKYCCKPSDTLSSGDGELVWLYHATSRLKICQPLGLFRKWRAELEEAGEKTVRVNVGRGEGKLLRVKKMNRKLADDNDADDGATEGEEGTSDDVPEEKPKREDRPEGSAPAANIVLGMTLPQWRHSPWAEPLIIVQHYDPSRLSEESSCDIATWRRQAREWWDESFAPEPGEALRVAKMAMDAEMFSNDIREAAEAAPYIFNTCRPTVPTGTPDHFDDCEFENEEELEDDAKALVKLFPGGSVVRITPRSPTEDDRIQFETDEQAEWQARMWAIQEAHEPGWAKRRLSVPYHPSERWDDTCRVAA
ncbi:hypothetical protein A6U97_13405 [Agrobacterium tumefaciens]|nr:hypothetical protein A6U97_13405 [Agrobacterium tumefaciens]